MKKRAEGGERSEINQRLMAVVKQKRLTQADLVRASGATSPTVTDWFNRGAVPDAERLARIAKAIRVNAHWLLTGQGPKSLPGEGQTQADQAYILGAQAIVIELGKVLRQFEAQYLGDQPIEPDEAAIAAVKALERARQQPRNASRRVR